MNILVISPHPDDEIIGCGGLIAHTKKIEAKDLLSVKLKSSSERGIGCLSSTRGVFTSLSI